MEKEKAKKQEGEVRPPTQAQFGLIRALREETQCKEIPERFDKADLNRDEASAFVHYLKEYKVRDQALRAANVRRSGLDKIAFGLVYKLLWRAMSETPLAVKPSKEDFIDAVIGEYMLFKQAQLACHQHVVDGGQK